MSSTLDAAAATLPDFCAAIGSVVHVTDVIGAVLVIGSGLPRIVVHIWVCVDSSGMLIADADGARQTVAVAAAAIATSAALTFFGGVVFMRIGRIRLGRSWLRRRWCWTRSSRCRGTRSHPSWCSRTA